MFSREQLSLGYENILSWMEYLLPIGFQHPEMEA